jgi:Fe-Mn family superoxide dismutase
MNLYDNVPAMVKKPRAVKPDVSLSKKQIDVHYDDLYLDYIKKLSEIKHRLKTADKKSADNEFRGLKIEEACILNAIRLHEAYFQNLKPTKKTPLIDNRISHSFGKFSKWEDDFIACGLNARGWAILGYDRIDRKLINIISDNCEMVMHVETLLVMDVFDHAYMIDFGTSKSKYVDFFMNNIDWECVTSRLVNIEDNYE